MKSLLEEDIRGLLRELFASTRKNEIYVRVGKFYEIFLDRYPLKYQEENKPVINSELLLGIIRDMGICSPFKFRRGHPKRYKFIRKKVMSEG